MLDRVFYILDPESDSNRLQLAVKPGPITIFENRDMSTPQLNLPIARHSLVDSVYDTLLEAVVSGQLPPGTEMNTVVLAEQLDVSRTPVKEALKILAHDGLVEHVKDHKARVARFSRQDVIEIYEVRGQLEAAAAERAAKLIDDRALQELRGEADKLLASRRDVDWSARAMEYDIRFHDVLAAACGNERLRKEIARYRLLVRGFCRLTGRDATLLQALREHIGIIDALQSRRPAAARKAMATHIQARLADVLRDVFENDTED